MKIKLNEKTYDVAEGTTLAKFLEELNIKPQGIAVAINYCVVPKNKWSETVLTDKLEMMLIHAVSGG